MNPYMMLGRGSLAISFAINFFIVCKVYINNILKEFISIELS